ncbi:hypothetical protein SMC26_10445 [Actinomadura fulvescens]|uniref:Secreted protein n=1 Tax=Actinomadura fulvescens TaxID=46160 RepID=A0ABP6CI21_9ACTN
MRKLTTLTAVGALGTMFTGGLVALPASATADTARPAAAKADTSMRAAGWRCWDARKSVKGASISARVCWKPTKRKGWYHASVGGTVWDTAGDSKRAALRVVHQYRTRTGGSESWGKYIATAKKKGQEAGGAWSSRGSFSGVRNVNVQACTTDRFNLRVKCSK